MLDMGIWQSRKIFTKRLNLPKQLQRGMMNDSMGMEPGFYWAKVFYPFLNKWDTEVIELRLMNKFEVENDGDSPEYEWWTCGSDVPIWPLTNINLLPNNGPLRPPPEAGNIEEVKAADPHAAAVAMVEHVKPVRDNGKD